MRRASNHYPLRMFCAELLIFGALAGFLLHGCTPQPPSIHPHEAPASQVPTSRAQIFCLGGCSR